MGVTGSQKLSAMPLLGDTRGVDRNQIFLTDIWSSFRNTLYPWLHNGGKHIHVTVHINAEYCKNVWRHDVNLIVDNG